MQKLGITFHRYPQTTATSMSAKFSVARSHDYGPVLNGVDYRVKWRDIEYPTSLSETPRFDWTAMDFFVERHRASRREIIFTLFGTPMEYALRPAEHSGYGEGCSSPPKDIGYWQRFVEAAATRYKGRVRYYEIWNEVNLQPEFWSGTDDELILLVQTASDIIRRIDSLANIIAPSVQGTEQGYNFEAFKRIMTRSKPYVDFANIHLYPQSGRLENLWAMQRLADQAVAFCRTLDLPLCNTEFGILRPAFVTLHRHQAAMVLMQLLYFTRECYMSVLYDGDVDGSAGMTTEQITDWNTIRSGIGKVIA